MALVKTACQLTLIVKIDGVFVKVLMWVMASFYTWALTRSLTAATAMAWMSVTHSPHLGCQATVFRKKTPTRVGMASSSMENLLL